MTDPRRRSLIPLAIGALGVVYGDIGTSPLYVMKAVFFNAEQVARTQTNVLGALSLIFWSLAVVVTVKYLVFVVRAEQNGEGGVFALLGCSAARR